MYDNAIVIFTSDNGGALYWPAGGNNWPKRGGKYSDFEGGVNTLAYVAGGRVPPGRRGVTVTALFSVADWAPTLCAAAGGDCGSDPEAVAAGLPDVDGLNQWPLLMNLVGTGPRTVLHLSELALVNGTLKLVTGVQPMSKWTGPVFPNDTSVQPSDIPKGWNFDCGAGCLFDIAADPNEHADLAAMRPAQLKAMQDQLAALNRNNFNPDRGKGSPEACRVAAETYGGFYGPFVDVA